MLPSFSPIIPTYNRPQHLSTCLQALSCLNYPRDQYEVIVVDDGSVVPLDEVNAQFKDKLNLSLLRQENAGPAAARNYGAAHAKAEFLAFTDDDCESVADWLRVFAAQFEKTPEVLLAGKSINKLTNNLFSSTSQLIVDIVYRHYNADPLQARFFAANNMAMPTGHFDKLSGFNTNFRTAEDRELCNRWRASGHGMIYVKKAVLRHAHALILRGFCRQHFAYGQGAYDYYQIRRLRGSGTMLDEMKFHSNFQNWLLYPFTQVHWLRLLSLAGVLLLWQIINAAGFFSEVVKSKLNQGMRHDKTR
jgi:glycosyltransferase involved in cell wall biosynthesis